MPDSEATTEITPGVAAPSAGPAGGMSSDPDLDSQSLWSAVRESLRAVIATTPKPGRAFNHCACHSDGLEMCMESIFAVVDIKWVSYLVPMRWRQLVYRVAETLVYTLAIGLSIGATATIARRIGEKNSDGAARAAYKPSARTDRFDRHRSHRARARAAVARFDGRQAEVIAQGSGFTRVMLACNASVVMLFMINAIFRGAGDAAIAMRVLWFANAINIVLGPCFIFGWGPFPELGVTGAAVATSIGRGTGALYALSRLARSDGRFEIRREHLRLEPAIMMRMIRISATGTFQVFIGMASWIGLVRIISTFGTNALAGYIIGIRVILFALLPSFGMSNAAATMVGQALGAGKPDRAERSVWTAGLYNMIFLGSVGLIFVLFARQIVGLFTHDPNVVPYGVDCLRIVAYGFLFYAYGMVLTQSFNGAGDTWTPTIINLFVFWLWELPLAYVLAIVFGLGPRGVFLAMMIAFSTLAIVSALVFRRGKWKGKTV